MERKTQTTVGELKIGDRFYRCQDKKKEVWQKVEHKVKQTGFQTYSHFAKRDADLHPQPLKKDTQVIFLRHGEEIPAR